MGIYGTKSQLNDLFQLLENDVQKEYIYQEWIKDLAKECLIHPTIKEYTGINFSDSNQIHNYLYPLLRVYPPVINYWLNNFVFPKEAKEFSGIIFDL